MSIKSVFHIKSNNESFDSTMQKIIDREVDSQAQRLKTAITKATTQIAKEAVMDWYRGSGLSTGADVAAAVKVESSFLRKSRGTKVIRVRGYFDEGQLDAMSAYYQSAIRWNAKHSDICDNTPGSYIFLLRWELGVTALPSKATATDTGWVNEHFEWSSLGSLESFMHLSIKTHLNDRIQEVVRGRNRSMGAGTESLNRTGISNLQH